MKQQLIILIADLKNVKLHFKLMYFNYSTIKVLKKALHLNSDKWFPWQPLQYSSHCSLGMKHSTAKAPRSQNSGQLYALYTVCLKQPPSHSSCGHHGNHAVSFRERARLLTGNNIQQICMDPFYQIAVSYFKICCYFLILTQGLAY